MRHRKIVVAVLAVVALAALAGCGAFGGPDSGDSAQTPAVTATETPATSADTETSETPATTETPTPADTPESEQPPETNETTPRIELTGELGVDHERTYRQLTTLLNTSADPPDRVIAKHTDSVGPSLNHSGGLYDLLIDTESRVVSGASGMYMYSDDTVLLATANRTQRDIAATLVHEYVHHIQYEQIRSKLDPRGPVGQARVIQALSEGGAVYVTDQYIDSYLNWTKLKQDELKQAEWLSDSRATASDINSQIELLAAYYPTLNAADRLTSAPYYFGSQYIAEHADSPSEYSDLFENPPRTTEALIHGYEPNETDRVPLAVNATLQTDARTITANRLGELTLRLTLFSELNESRAISAATGWGNDTLVRTAYGPTRGVWMIKMDTASDATALHDAMTAYLDSRAQPGDDLWFDQDDQLFLTTERVGNRTVVLGFGTEVFLQTLDVTQADGEIQITAGSSSDASSSL